MAPMQLSPMALQHQPPPPPPHHGNGSVGGSIQGNNRVVLDYLENQVRGLDYVAPQVAPQNVPLLKAMPAPPQVPNTPGPPSMLSALDEMGVRGVERRVITLPPIIQRVPSFSSRRGPGGGGDVARAAPRMSSHSSGSTNRSAGGLNRDSRGSRDGYRNASPPRRGILRDYGDDLDRDNRQERVSHRGSRNEREGSSRRGGSGSRRRARSRDDVMDESQGRASRRERSYSPPRHRNGSWSSEEEDTTRRKGGSGKDWPEKPPSYYSIDIQPSRSNNRMNYNPLSVRSTNS